MIASGFRTATRPSRHHVTVVKRTNANYLRNSLKRVRFQSTSTTGGQQASSDSSGHLVAGLAGGTSAFFLGYLWYHFSGAKTLINTSNQAQAYFQSTFKKTKEAAESSNSSDTLDYLRQTAHDYTRLIPGASAYVDSAFNDVNKVREKHGDEVDKILKEAKDQLKDVTGKPVNLERVSEVWSIVSDALRKIGGMAGDSAEEILNNHPQIREKVGPKLGQFRQMGEQYGPEAKKMVDETWQQMQDILKAGFSMEAVGKVQNLIQQKTEQLQKYGEKAWENGMEQVKPMLDKKPELKELVEKNKDKLLKGDLGELWNQVKKASESGNTDDLKKFVQDQTEKVQQKTGGGGGLPGVLQNLPGGANIGSNLQQLSELSQKYGKEAEELVNSTLKEVQDVLQKKVQEGKSLKEKVEKEAK